MNRPLLETTTKQAKKKPETFVFELLIALDFRSGGLTWFPFCQVNLCFDQFVYKLADQIFAYYKVMAGR